MKYLAHRVWLSASRFEWLANAARRVPVMRSAEGGFVQPWFEFKGTMYLQDLRQ